MKSNLYIYNSAINFPFDSGKAPQSFGASVSTWIRQLNNMAVKVYSEKESLCCTVWVNFVWIISCITGKESWNKLRTWVKIFQQQ